MIPAWAIAGVAALLTAAMRLIQARTDDEREEALMQAAEDIKAALDAKKFGSG